MENYIMRKKLALITITTLLLTGCAAGYSPVGNALITHVKGPILATDNVSTTKMGTACAKSIILYAIGDASIDSAKKAGGIRKVASIDYESQGFYPFYGKTCIIVRGE